MTDELNLKKIQDDTKIEITDNDISKVMELIKIINSYLEEGLAFNIDQLKFLLETNYKLDLDYINAVIQEMFNKGLIEDKNGTCMITLVKWK